MTVMLRLGQILLLSVCIAVLPCMFRIAIAAESPSAVALLRGVEASRMQYKSLQASLTFEYISPGPYRKVDGILEMASNGTQRRLELFATADDIGSVTVLNDNELHGYRRKEHEDVWVYDMDYAVGVRSDVVFDLRVLGLTDLLAADTTVKACLWYENAKSLEVVGQEQLNKTAVWHVRATTDQAVSDYWIEEPSFRVHRRTITWTGGRVEIDSEFDNEDKTCSIPRSATSTRKDSGLTATVRSVTVDKLDVEAVVPSERFTLESMDVPINTAVVDYRIQRRVGYWDGHDLSEDPIPASQLTGVSRDGGGWLRASLLALNIIVVIGLLVVIWFRARTRRRA